tara:strand:+ start:15314 stop:16021 length:708 start_codon:yes stop_codon:yes gene_type:complete
MPTTQVAKLLNRQGNFADLPLLDPGELGYAKDQKRLFIGNDPVSVTSNGGASYTVAVDLTQSGRYRVTTQASGGAETEVSSANFSIGGTTLTLTTAPAVGVTIRIYYNSEVQMHNEASGNPKTDITLTASGTNADTGIEWDADDYNCATIDYSLQNAATPTPKFRNGKITIMIDTRAGVQDYMLQDDYVAVNDPAVTFSGNLNTSDNVFKLRYSDSDAVNATFSYDLKLWKTTLG